MHIRFTGTYKKRAFCYFGGAKVVTFGSVWDSTFKVEPTTDHKDLLDECRKQLQNSPAYETFRKGKTQMSWQGSAVHANGVQTKNKGRTVPGKSKRST